MIIRQTSITRYLLAFSFVFCSLIKAETDLVTGDLSNGQDDYDCVVWLDQKEYTGTIPGKSSTKDLSDTKWYFNCAFFKNNNLVQVRAFPTKLLVKTEELKKFKPIYAGFLPRTHIGWRDLVTVEGDQLCLYNVNAQKDEKTGDFWASVDFGKRTPLHNNVNAMSIVGDSNGNIYFMTKDNKSCMWDSKTETVKSGVKIPTDLPKNPSYNSSESNNTLMVTIGNQNFKVPLHTSIEIVDPLSIDTKRPHAPAHHTKVISELKLVAREHGATGTLKKKFTNTEVSAVEKALDLAHGGGGVGPFFDKLDKQGRAHVDKNQQIAVSLGYYRALKSAHKKGFNKKDFEDPDQVSTLSNAVTGYAVNTMTHNDNWKIILARFMQVPEQKSWAEWFEKTGKNYKEHTWTQEDVDYELLFDYLASLSDKDLNEKLTEAGLTHIKQIKLKRIIDIYKKTSLYSGK